MGKKPLSLLSSKEVLNPDVDDWSSYVERLESFFVANDVEDKNKVAFPVIVIGTKAYSSCETLLRQQKQLIKLTSNW